MTVVAAVLVVIVCVTALAALSIATGREPRGCAGPGAGGLCCRAGSRRASPCPHRPEDEP